MAKSFPTQNRDRCASDYERGIIDDLIDRGVDYGYESAIGSSRKFRISYTTPIVRGECGSCGAKGAPVVQRRSYTPDIHLPSGVIVEVKGKFPPAKRTLMRYAIRCNADHDIRFIFMADTWMTKAKKRRLSDWCRAQGIIYQVGDPRAKPGTVAYGSGGIPQEWIYGDDEDGNQR